MSSDDLEHREVNEQFQFFFCCCCFSICNCAIVLFVPLQRIKHPIPFCNDPDEEQMCWWYTQDAGEAKKKIIIVIKRKEKGNYIARTRASKKKNGSAQEKE